jgi:glycosyltransferase involved in cell wall biosynthesis
VTAPARILHVSPSYYGDESVVGGGEKYVMYCAEAVRIAAARDGVSIDGGALSFGEREAVHVTDTGFTFELIPGKPWDPFTVDASQLRARLQPATVVHVHQCLSQIGLCMAMHARLLGKFVIGTDHGTSENSMTAIAPEVGAVFDWFHAQSVFAAHSFADVEGETRVIRGPVDTDKYTARNPAERVAGSVLSIGRILAHKCFVRIIPVLPDGSSLTIVGRPMDAEYLSHLRQLGRGRKVRLDTGATDDQVRAQIRSADLAVFASTHRDYRGQFYAKPELLGLAALECLATGVPTFVSNAGALPELAELPGCHAFATDAELHTLFEAHRDGSLPVPDPREMHEVVAQRYGLLAFGRAYLENLGAKSR